MRTLALLALAAALAACGDGVVAREAAPASARQVTSRAPRRGDPGDSSDAPVAVDPATLAAWVEELRSDDPAVRDAAIASLRAAGDAAVPAMLARYFDQEFLCFEDDALIRLLVERRDAVVPEVLAKYDAGF